MPASPQTKRIAGTLHKRGCDHPAPLQDQNLAREKAEESEVAGRHKNSGQKDHKGARWPMAKCPTPIHNNSSTERCKFC